MPCRIKTVENQNCTIKRVRNEYQDMKITERTKTIINS